MPFYNPTILKECICPLIITQVNSFANIANDISCAGLANDLSCARISCRAITDKLQQVQDVVGCHWRSRLISKVDGEDIPRSGYVKFIAMLLGTPTSSKSRLGSPVMTVWAEKSTRLAIKLPRRHPSLPFNLARIAFTGQPDFCNAWGIPAISLSMYVATWNCEKVRACSNISLSTRYLEKLLKFCRHMCRSTFRLTFPDIDRCLDDVTKLIC